MSDWEKLGRGTIEVPLPPPGPIGPELTFTMDSGPAATAPAILRRCIADIEARGAVRDLPDGERSMARAVAAYNALTGHQLTERDGWLFMAVLKASRATAGAHHLDDWVDMAAYAALAGEAAEREGSTWEPTSE